MRPILLAHSYYLRYDEKQWRKMKPYPPLATLQVASLLRSRCLDVRLFDAMLATGVEEFYHELDAVKPSIVLFVEDNFNFLTKMCTVRMRAAGIDTIRAAKAAGCQVAVNGSDAADHPEMYLSAGADAVILGEPELTVLDLVDAWTTDPEASLSHVAGLALNGHPPGDEPAITRTPARPSLGELDSLPFQAWDLVDVELYRKHWVSAHGQMSWNVVASRGCPYKCNWCAKPLFGTRYAQRSPAHVAEELRLMKREVMPDHIWFADDIFGLTSPWIESFADEVTDRDARIPFTMQSRVNLMKPKTVEALAEAGCREVWLGVESGSQRILDAMDKGTRVAQVRNATRTLQAHGIRSCWFVQLGYLGEGWDDIVLTRDLIRDERPDDIGVSVSYPLPGTGFYEIVQGQLGQKTNWDDSADLAMMFSGTYPTDFYKAIRNLLHDEVDAGALLDAGTQRAFDRRWSELEQQAAEYHASELVAGPSK